MKYGSIMEELTELGCQRDLELAFFGRNGGNSRNFTTKMGTTAIFMGILWDRISWDIVAHDTVGFLVLDMDESSHHG